MIGALIAKKRAKEQFAGRSRGDLDQFLVGWAEDATLTFPGNQSALGRHPSGQSGDSPVV